MKDRVRVDDRYRSLLQKAVRRGRTDWVYTVSALIENLGTPTDTWFEKRSAAIVFGECWPAGRDMVFTRGFHSKVAALVRVAGARKARDASGLGFMAYALSKGDVSVLNQTADDRALKVIAKAIRHPDDFWNWISSQPGDDRSRSLIASAGRYRDGGRPHDKAVVQAAAYLALGASPEEPELAPKGEFIFPFWVVFDRHTSEGKRVLRDVARDLHIPLPQLEWCFFVFEGAVANCEAPSPWWQRYCRWHFDRIGLSAAEAHLIWEPARLQIADALAEDSHRLQTDLYRWKLAHRERVETLKRQVELFAGHIGEVPKDQPSLF